MREILMMEQFWAFVSAALAFIAAFLPPLLSMVGIKRSEALMAKLHSAIMSAAMSAVSQGLGPKEAAALLFDHLFSSVGDTMDALKPPPEVLATIFQGKIGKAAQELGVVPSSGQFPPVGDAVIEAALSRLPRPKG